MARLADVARRAGVSLTTASHALIGYPDISEKTRQRVLQVARELDYEVDSLARGLARRKSGLVGVLIFGEGIAHPFFQRVATRAIEEIEARDLNAVVSTVDPKRFETAPIFRKMVRYRLEGLVVMGICERHPAVERIISRRIPTVFVDAALAGPAFTSVRTDNRRGGYLAGRYLLDLGHRRLLFVNDLSEATIFRDRRQGLEDAFRERGLEFSPALEVRASTQVEDGHRVARHWLALAPRPTAILAVDRVALGVIQYLATLGMDVPEGVSVMGYDDIDMAAMSRPPLTTIRQDACEIARQAVQLLDELLKDPGETPPPRLVTPSLVVRASVGQAKAG
ncbi:MAG: LacI family DNA-binding transcriptional regulator [Bacillota bacterium]